MHNPHEKGSTLIFVLLILSTLSMLAITLLSTTVINYKMKILNSKSQKSFYLAESGLDEAYGIIGKMIEEAILEGNKKAKDFLNNLDLQKEKQNFFDDYFISNKEKEEEALEDVSESFEKHILSLKQTVFQAAYKNYIEINLKNRIEKHEMLIENKRQQPLCIVSNPLKFFEIENKGDSNSTNKKKEILLINVQSTYVKDKIERIIEGHFIIEVPEYGASNSNYTLKEMRKILTNPIWGNCLITGGNLRIDQENIKMDMDTYKEKVDISQYIDFSKVKNRFIHHHKDFILFNNNDQDFAIIGKSPHPSRIPENTERILLNRSADGIVIISGNLYLCGEIDFTGTIITKGEINILDADNETFIKIKYDENVVTKLLDKYDIYFKDIFLKNNEETFIEVECESKIPEEIVPFGDLQDRYVRLQNWKILR